MSVINLTLDKVIKGSADHLDLTFCITQLDETEYDCILTTINLKGKPIADGLEISLAPENNSSQDDQTWTLKKPSGAIVEDDEENEIHIQLQEAVLKTTKDGAPMAMAALGKEGEDVLTTENWKE